MADWQLPSAAEMSVEVDVAVDVAFAHLDASADETALADEIDGAIGRDSPFHQRHGYYADGVEIATAVLTAGWRDRLVPVAPEGNVEVVGWCLEINDVWVSKAAAARSKDYEFCAALAEAGLVEADLCAERIAQL